MTTYILKRLGQSLVVIVFASIVIFLLLHMAPGDPAQTLAGPDASPETIEALRERMGLNQPLPTQYWTWLTRAVQGDLGESLLIGVSVGELIGQRLPATLELAFVALIIAVFLGLTSGLLASRKPGGLTDSLVSWLNGFALSIPNFWLGILGILLFSLTLGWLPPGGRESLVSNPLLGLQHIILPAVTLAIAPAALISRLVRASMLDEISKPYALVARAKGVNSRTIMWRHALRNALVPVVTVIGLRFGDLVGGAVIVESVFSWPGLGRLMVDSISNRDIVIVQGALLWLVVAYLMINLITDLSYGLLNPRIRVEARS